MKRERDEPTSVVDQAIPPALEDAAEVAPAASDDDTLSVLANWCDEKLRAVATELDAALAGPDAATPFPNRPAGDLHQLLDDSFGDFLEELGAEQRLGVAELKKGEIAQAWRCAGADAWRAMKLQSVFAFPDTFANEFHSSGHATKCLEEMNNVTADAFDLFLFNIAWDLACKLLAVGVEEISSGDNDSDEPVEESDSDSGGETGEESEESGSGSSSGASEDEN